MRLLQPGKTEKESRLKFVKHWAEYVRTHSDADWSKQQKKLIDSQIKNTRQNPIPVEIYLKMKNNVKNFC